MMTPEEIVTQVQARTKHPNSGTVTNELLAAYRWAHRRVFNTENGPNLNVIIGEEITLAARTKEYELDIVTVESFLAIKQIWLRLPGETTFTPMVSADTNDPAFMAWDSDPNSSTLVASGHPVGYNSINFGSVRFAPALPATSVIRVDYFTQFDGDCNGPSANMCGVIEDAVMDKCTSLVFNLLDDDRWTKWEASANTNLTDAIWVLQKRVQGPTTTTPWRGARRRGVI